MVVVSVETEVRDGCGVGREEIDDKVEASDEVEASERDGETEE